MSPEPFTSACCSTGITTCDEGLVRGEAFLVRTIQVPFWERVSSSSIRVLLAFGLHGTRPRGIFTVREPSTITW